MAEDRAEDTNIVAPPITDANYGLRSHLVCNPKPRSQMCKAGTGVPSQVHAVLAGVARFAGGQINPCSLSLRGGRFRHPDFPAQAVIQSELWCDPPRVLAVVEQAGV